MPLTKFDSYDLHARNTPIQIADRLAASIGLEPGQIWIKRDDLTGLVGGGNKARKLEFLLADAIKAGADTLVTGGAAQSNHVRATAAAARVAGLSCVAILAAEAVPETAEGNLVLDDLLGLEIVWANPEDRFDAFDRTLASLVETGRTPYPIPLGGSSPLGAAAYCQCATEISSELGDELVVVCAVGSGGTFAGLINGFGPSTHLLGFDVAAVATISTEVDVLVPATAELVGASGQATWELDASMTHIAYGEPSDQVFSAIRLLAETEGLVLDPVYSGKAMAGLISRLETGWDPGQRRIVFVHTGGLPALMTGRYQAKYSDPESMTGK